MNIDDLPFKQIFAVDFEFIAHDGNRPEPVCMVCKEMKTGRLLRVWRDELSSLSSPPFPISADVLFVAYYATAEFNCFHVLGWPMPHRIMDLYAEFRRATSGLELLSGAGLLGAMVAYGLPCIDAAEKDQMRQLILGGRYSDEDRSAILDYCESDVTNLAKLLPAMLAKGHIDLSRALFRGRYVAALSKVEHNGVPIDAPMLNQIRRRWEAIQDELIAEIDHGYGVYEGRSFRAERWASWLAAHQISWPTHDTGRLDLSRDAFRQMARAYPEVAPIGDLRHAMSELKLNDLAVGSDGRNRCLLSPFASKTGRNQPSTTKFIFGLPAWLRFLLKPERGRAVAYLDWAQQEFAVAAKLSGDPAMMEAYTSADPYLTFAKQAGAVPQDATKESHRTERELFKVVALAVQYGQGAKSLAERLGIALPYARTMLDLHHRTYPTYWSWSDAIETQAMLSGELTTVFGWKVHAGPGANPRSLRNFPMQGNGAEMLRLAICLGVEAGVMVDAPVHDALLIEDNIENIDATVAKMQNIMAEAAAIVLDGFPLRSDAKVVRFPDRYSDPRGDRMWKVVSKRVQEVTGPTLPVNETLLPDAVGNPYHR